MSEFKGRIIESIDTTEERWSIQREQLANLGGGWRHVAWTTGTEMQDDPTPIPRMPGRQDHTAQHSHGNCL